MVGGEGGGRLGKWTEITCQKRRKAQNRDLGKRRTWQNRDKPQRRSDEKNICGNSLTSLQERKITCDTAICSPRLHFTHLHSGKSLKYVLKARPACQHFRRLGTLGASIHLGRLWFWYQENISLSLFYFFSSNAQLSPPTANRLFLKSGALEDNQKRISAINCGK